MHSRLLVEMLKLMLIFSLWVVTGMNLKPIIGTWLWATEMMLWSCIDTSWRLLSIWPKTFSKMLNKGSAWSLFYLIFASLLTISFYSLSLSLSCTIVHKQKHILVAFIWLWWMSCILFHSCYWCVRSAELLLDVCLCLWPNIYFHQRLNSGCLESVSFPIYIYITFVCLSFLFTFLSSMCIP